MASWKMMALPKSIRGWDLKTTFLFSKSLATKNVWRLIQGICLLFPQIEKYYLNNLESCYLHFPSGWQLVDLTNWKRR